MPCWSQQTNEAKMEKMTGEKLTLLRAALVNSGHHVYANWKGYELAADHFANGTSVLVKDGNVSVTLSKHASVSMEEATRLVKKSYAATVVAAALKKFGWNSTTEKVSGKLLARRRY